MFKVFILGLSWSVLASFPGAVSSVFAAESPQEESSFYQIEVEQPSWSQTLLTFTLRDYELQTKEIEGSPYTEIVMGLASKTSDLGYPELPRVPLAVAVPCEALDHEVSKGKFSRSQISYRVEKQTMRIKAPPPVASKGSLERQVNPQDVPWTFGDIYRRDHGDQGFHGTPWVRQTNPRPSIYPFTSWSVSKPYVLRAVCGVNLTVYPFQYDFSTQELVIVKGLHVTIDTGGLEDQSRFLRAQKTPQSGDFLEIYRNHFLNFPALENRLHLATPAVMGDRGSLLIVTREMFLGHLEAWRRAKHQLGIQTEVVLLEEIGDQWQDVKRRIQSSYANDPHLAAVLLVGDAELVPFHPGTMGNAGGKPADPMYGLLDGQDSYPEVIVGRISVKTGDELATVLHKTLAYEFEPDPEGAWYGRATGIASREGEPTDARRADLLRERLLQSTYGSVDRFYEPWAREQDLIQAFNEGRGFVNYTGHGSFKSWATGGFSRDSIDRLQNKNRLPVIVSVACVNGRFDYRFGDSFAERWLKAGSKENPTGAVAIFASSTNQAWVPPTIGQKKIVDLVARGKTRSVGFLFANGSIAVLNDGSPEAEQTFQTWHIFGDPTLQMRVKMPQSIRAVIPEQVDLTKGEDLLIDLSGLKEPARAVLTSNDGVYRVQELGRGETSVVFTADELDAASPSVTLTLSGGDHKPLAQEIRLLR